jgi:hypothetical protein
VNRRRQDRSLTEHRSNNLVDCEETLRSDSFGELLALGSLSEGRFGNAKDVAASPVI